MNPNFHDSLRVSLVSGADVEFGDRVHRLKQVFLPWSINLSLKIIKIATNGRSES